MRIKLTDQMITETKTWTGRYAGQRPTFVQREYRAAHARLAMLATATGETADRARDEHMQIVIDLEDHPAIALLSDEERESLEKGDG